jgi:hypothetical protein
VIVEDFSAALLYIKFSAFPAVSWPFEFAQLFIILDPNVFISTWFQCYNFLGSVPGPTTCPCDLLRQFACLIQYLFSSVHCFGLPSLRLFLRLFCVHFRNLNSWSGERRKFWEKQQHSSTVELSFSNLYFCV